MRTLVNDSRGTADWMEREARRMHPMQMYREFVQNGIEAGASAIAIDGYYDESAGQMLARISDNGCGLTPRQLEKNLTELHGRHKGAANYGVGARMAALPRNQAGVTFASRSLEAEAMLVLWKYRGEYGTKTWEVEEDGYEVKKDVVGPDPGMLDVLGRRSTGTAVILHGDGRNNTWNASEAYQVHLFLARRYFRLPIKISVLRPGDNGHAQFQRVHPMGEYFDRVSRDRGEFRFKNVDGLSGVMRWWIIPSADEARQLVQARNVVSAGVGLVHSDEVFAYERVYSGDFGLIYSSVAARTAVLIEVDGAEMGTARADVVLPGHSRGVPWKKLGAYFADNMPRPIAELIAKEAASSSVFGPALAKLLDEDWMKNLQPVPINAPRREGEEDSGTSEPPGGARDGDGAESDGSESNAERRPRPAGRREGGGSSVRSKKQIMVPEVEFTDDFPYEEHPLGISWFENSNKVLIAGDFSPYIREVGRWELRTRLPKPVVEEAVRLAYRVEYAATIIDANGQGKHGRTPDEIDRIKSDHSLYAKALGMQSLTQRIDTYISDPATRQTESVGTA